MATPPYYLELDGVHARLRVHSLRGKEAISRTWHFDVVVSAGLGEGLERVALGQRATLVFSFGENQRAFYGVVASVDIQEVHAIDREAKYAVRVVPRMWLLRRKKKTRVFQGMRVPDIAAAVLADAGIATRWTLARAYPVREYCTQYEETDYDFVRRILAECGIYFYFFGGPPVGAAALAANMAVGVAGASASAALGAIAGDATAALVDTAAMLAQTLVPGDTVVGGDDATAYPGVAGDDPAALAAATAASMAASVAGLAGAGGTEAAAIGAATVGNIVVALTRGKPLPLRFSRNESDTALGYADIGRFGLRNAVKSTGAVFRDYDPDKPLVRLQSTAVSTAPFPPSPFEVAAAAAATAQNVANAVAVMNPAASTEITGVADAAAQAQGAVEGVAQAAGQTVPFELYEHHSPFLFPKWVFAYDEAPLILRQARRNASVATGESGCHDLSPAHSFELGSHLAPQLDGGYVVTTVNHFGEAETEREHRRRVYYNTFECAPDSIAYVPKRPRRRTIQVALTATVVGPAGTDIHVDDRGRVKVQFHWDREGKYDGRSSCWVRTMQGWAGASWGHQFIPRVGMEVVVVFDGGDPDKPMVLGAVYNATHPSSFPLPEDKTKSGIRTQTTPYSGGYNELSFEDGKGREEVFLRAQKDLREEILNDRRTSVTGSVDERIGKSRASTIAHDLHEDIGGDHHSQVRGVHYDFVKGNRTSSVSGAYTVGVVGEMSIVVGTKKKPRVGEILAYGDCVVGASRHVDIRADESIRLHCGKSFVEITPDEIRMSADSLVLDGKSSTTLKGKGPGLKLGDAAEITAKNIRIISETASLLLDKEVKLDGAQIKLNCPGMAPSPKGLEDKPQTKKVELRLTDEDFKALSGKQFILMAGGAKFEGSTDGDGNLSVEVPAIAETASLTVFGDERPEGKQYNYRIRLEALPPPDTVQGVKARLENLGYYWGESNDVIDDIVTEALRQFQIDHALEVTGKPDAASQAKLASVVKQ